MSGQPFLQVGLMTVVVPSNSPSNYTSTQGEAPSLLSEGCASQGSQAYVVEENRIPIIRGYANVPDRDHQPTGACRRKNIDSELLPLVGHV